MAEATGRAAGRVSLGEALWTTARDAGSRRNRTAIRPALTAGLALAILAAAASAALMGLAGWLIVRSAQTGLSATSTFSWIYPSAGVEALAVVRIAARYGERLRTHGATLHMLARLRARVFASATRMTPRQLHRFHSGDLLDRVQADIDSLDHVILGVAVPAVVAGVVGASGLTVLALIRPAFAVTVTIALAVAIAGVLAVGRRGRPTGEELARSRAAARARLIEVLDGRMEIAAFGTGPRALAELGERFRATDSPRRRWSSREGAARLVIDLAATGAVAALLASGAGLDTSPLPPAVLAFAVLLTMTLFEVTGALAAAGPSAGRALAAWRRLQDVSGLGAQQGSVAEPQHGAPGTDAWDSCDITIRCLVAGMGTTAALWVDELHLPGGGLTLVTGPSGAGKSTLLRVLSGALGPMAGSVRIGRTDLQAVGYEHLVACVTAVEQDSRLLSGTVAENLLLARPNATPHELRAAMKLAVLARDIELDSEIGAGGEGLSGGQRRRLGVAQAYLRRPGLLLLDEPTEGLDRDTARALLTNLRSALPGTTIIAAIHDRMLDHLPWAADTTVRLAAGQVVRVTGGVPDLEPVGLHLRPPSMTTPAGLRRRARSWPPPA